jgi:ribulose-phosphate 3-epimerase
MSIIISPSILNANFEKLQDDIAMLNKSESDWIHLDIMDGVFVPNISFGTPVIEAVRKTSTKPLDVHLMIVDPDRHIDHFHSLGATFLNVHYEVCNHLHRTVHYIKSKGMKAGVTINPHTPVNVLEDIIADVDLLLVMSVNPGFGGQTFIENTYNKTAALKNLILKKNSKALIQVDGGVDLSNINKLKKSGVDSFVIGSFIFRSKNPTETIRQLKIEGNKE